MAAPAGIVSAKFSKNLLCETNQEKLHLPQTWDLIFKTNGVKAIRFGRCVN